jgi:hypothetical protein
MTMKNTYLDEIKAVHATLQLPKPENDNWQNFIQLKWKAVQWRNMLDWKRTQWRRIVTLLAWITFPVAATIFFFQAIITDNITYFWVAFGFSIAFLLFWVIRSYHQFSQEIGNAPHEIIATISENNDAETKLLENLLVFSEKALEHVHDQYENSINIMENRMNFIGGSIRQTGIMGAFLTLIAAYIGILKNIPEVKDISLIILPSIFGVLLGATLFQDILDKIRFRQGILRRTIKLKKQ